MVDNPLPAKTKTHWIVWGKLEAYEGKKKVLEREWNEEIERKLQ